MEQGLSVLTASHPIEESAVVAGPTVVEGTKELALVMVVVKAKAVLVVETISVCVEAVITITRIGKSWCGNGIHNTI